MPAVGRYAMFGEIASGGMATVHLGRLVGAVGFSRIVAIKRLHRQYARDARFVSMFVDEARLAARIQHPNVVQTIDVVATDDELFQVMEYVHGVALSQLAREGKKLRALETGSTTGSAFPIDILATISIGMLHGLHAAHEAHSERGEPLQIVHRDVSPQNVLVGVDGVARVIDFGVAKATGRVQSTDDGQLKGKLSYMAPEQLRGETVSRRTDVYAAAVVLWEALTGKVLYDGENQAVVFGKVLRGRVAPPSRVVAGPPPELDEVILRGLAPDPADRYATARDFALAVEERVPGASATKVGAWVERVAHALLERRATMVREVERAETAPLATLGAPTTVPPPAPGGTHRQTEPHTMEVVAAFAAAAAASGAGAPGGSPDQPATVAGTPQAQQRVAGVGSSPSRRTAAIAAQHAQLAHAAVAADLPADATRFAPLMPPVSAQSQVLSSPPPPTGAFPLPPPHSFPPPPLSAPRAGGSSSGGRSGSGSVSGTSRRKAASGGVTDNSAQRAALITVVSGLLAALLIAALVRMRHMNESRAGARPSLASASTSAPVVPQPTLPVPAFDEPTSTNGLAPGTPASASPSPSPPGNAAAPAGGARGVVRSPTSGRRPATASSARPGCDPPYFFDPQGVKIYKPDCVE